MHRSSYRRPVAGLIAGTNGFEASRLGRPTPNAMSSTEDRVDLEIELEHARRDTAPRTVAVAQPIAPGSRAYTSIVCALGSTIQYSATPSDA